VTTAVRSVDAALVERVRARLSADRSVVVSPGRVAAALRAEGTVLGDAELLHVVATLTPELGGLGLLQPLVDDPAVTDVLVNAPDDVWVERSGRLVRTEVRFRDDAAVRALAQRLVAAAGRRVDDAVPFADVVLPADVRVHVALSPVAARGTCLSLRVGRRRAMSLGELVANGSLGVETAAVLEGLVHARVSVVVTGGAGSGKTTLLATLLGLVPPTERVVVVEDSAELRPVHPHTVLLEGRPPNVEGAGRVELRELVRQALRMRPDRLVVGEVRGAEALDMLQALNTGHDGSLSTIHANSPADALTRLETLVLLADSGLPLAAVRAQIAASVDAVVFVARRAGGARRIEAIAEVGDDATDVRLLCRWDGVGLVRVGAPTRPGRRVGTASLGEGPFAC
jgi:pilus assembly protein CpaF